MKRVVFFTSSAGDTKLALDIAAAMKAKVEYSPVIITLTKTAAECVAKSPIDKISLHEILGSDYGALTDLQLGKVIEYIELQNIGSAYVGVPSENNEIPFQIARALGIPVLIAYEFMFKPETHCLWKYLPELNGKPNVQWAIPLPSAIEDFADVSAKKIHVVGHLSIDAATSTADSTLSTSYAAIKDTLQITAEQSLAFVSSTTQPVAIDEIFLHSLLSELPKHPTIQVRFGIHPGIQNLENYLARINSVCQAHPDALKQFKIILPDPIFIKVQDCVLFKDPAFQQLFLRVNINGAQASSAADRVAQAVPGALLNQAALEGKPAYYDTYDLDLLSAETKHNPRTIYLTHTTHALQYEVMSPDGTTKNGSIPWDELHDCPRSVPDIIHGKVKWLPILLKHTSKASHTCTITPYLPPQCFTDSMATFFSAERKPPMLKEELGLNDSTAPESCMDIMLR